MKNKKVLVTGGCGAIGYWLSKKIADDGNLLTIIDNNLNSKKDKYFKLLIKMPNVIFLNIDLNNYNNLKKIKCNFDYIFHFAAFNGTENFYHLSFDVLLNSTLPTINLIKWLVESESISSCKFIYAGSSEVYSGAISYYSHHIPTNELVPCVIDDITNPRWSYGASKLHGEAAVFSAINQYSLDATILRLHNVYGMRMGLKHFIPDFISRVIKEKYELYGAYDTRTFIFVEDAVNLIIKLSESKLTNKKIVNLGSNQEIMILDLANKILDLMQINQSIKKSIKIFDSPKGSVKRRCPDISIMNSLVKNYKFTSLNDGLLKTIDFYTKNNH